MVELGVVSDVVLGASPTTVSMDLAPAPVDAREAYLTIEDIEMDHHPGIVYAVEIDDERVGFLSFFGVGHREPSPVREFEVSRVIGFPAGRVSIAFVPTGLEPPEGYEGPPEDATGSAADAGVRLGRVRLVAS
jgi:hypothetical protein